MLLSVAVDVVVDWNNLIKYVVNAAYFYTHTHTYICSSLITLMSFTHAQFMLPAPRLLL